MEKMLQINNVLSITSPLEMLEYIHSQLQEIQFKQKNSTLNGFDERSKEVCLAFIEHLREPYLKSVAYVNKENNDV